MNLNDWERTKELFEAALQLEPSQRASFLAANCHEVDLQQQVEKLLIDYQAAGTFLDEPALHSPDETAELEDSMVNRRLGAYKLVRRLGQGGMAAVFLAVRADDAYQKEVAVKLVQPGLDSQVVMSRFRSERQTLAGLEHPNIVRLLDGGSAPEGWPFLVMEYVEGMPIDEYCDQHKLSVDDRLRLFGEVCDAVQYAHEKLVIHRDLKPSNILVLADGTPKLLDFGIAKVLNPEPSNQDWLATRTELWCMTPAYASPEQARRKPVTSETDVYSLGVVLYELLTGHRPYRLTQHSPAEIEQAICEQEPENPSTAISRVETDTSPDGRTTTKTPELVCLTREGQPDKLRRRLRGDLDNIVLKALKKEPQQRYSSVAEFSQDIHRHLQHQPVRARPSTFAYRVSKFAQRHKTGVGAAFAVLVIAAAAVSFASLNLGQMHIVRLTTSGNAESLAIPRDNLTMRQLTASTPDDFIENAVISPDGKYLAYIQKAGALLLRSIDTGETRVLIPAPANVYPNSWFPNGSQLLVIKGDDDGLWKLSVLTGKLTKLVKANNGIGRGIVSPDGTHILYGDGEREIWMMGAEGQEAHRVMAVGPSEFLWSYAWAPTGQRFAYMIFRHRPDGKEDASIETRDIEARQQSTVPVSSVDLVQNFAPPLLWLPDGRIIYSLTEPPPNQEDSNFWAIKVDPANGEALTASQRLTHWVGFDTNYVSATANGKQLVFMKTHIRKSIFMARVIAKPKLRVAKVDHLTTDTWGSRVDGWTPDSREIFISSDKGGRYGIYKQSIDQQVSKAVITGAEDYYDARLSADGASLLYTASRGGGPRYSGRKTSEPTRLMSVSIAGGAPLLLAKGKYESNYRYQCALPPSKVCVMAEEKKDQHSFYWLDPKVGPASEPFKITGELVQWSLSPDGQQIAIVEPSAQDRVKIFSMKDGTLRELELRKGSRWLGLAQYLEWLPSGNGLYVTAFLSTGTSLLAVTLDGNVTVLLQQGHNYLACPRVAPNGQLLAFSVYEMESDVAITEYF